MSDRTDRGLASLEDLASLIALAAELSTGLRARAVQRYDLFKENVRRARAKILQLGGSPRDADQLGHLIAGWACLTGDAPLSEDEIGRLDRFVPYIITIHDADN